MADCSEGVSQPQLPASDSQPPSNEYDPSKDPKRKAKSKDPGWKYGFWPDLTNKDLVQCCLCGKQVHSGIKRLKQHLAAGFGDVEKCPKTTTAIMREMNEYIKKTARSVKIVLDDDDEEGDDGHKDEDDAQRAPVEASSRASSCHSSVPIPSSGTAAKRKQSTIAFKLVAKEAKVTKSVAAIIKRTPEEVVEERHSKQPSQTSIEHCMRTKEEKETVWQHIADFFYEAGVSFNAANARSFEIMLESIGQYGTGLRPPSMYQLRVPLLAKAKAKIQTRVHKLEVEWKKYGCTLMCDGWTDMRRRHLINFLVNCPEGTCFTESVNASSEVADARMLAALIERKVEEVGVHNVVQIVTDNGANFKAACRLVMDKYPTIFWTPCAAHCLNLMLQDIGKSIAPFKKAINQAQAVTTFIYRHGRVLDAMREKTGGKDLVRPAATRFATSFLTLQCMYKFKDALRQLFVSEDWSRCKLASTEAGKKVCDTLLSMQFWNSVEDCIRASQPLLVALRIADGDEIPAMPEIVAAMDLARNKISTSLANKPSLLKKVMDIIEKRWVNQMEQKLYGAALFLNPNKFFDIRENDVEYASRLRIQFNDVLEKMVRDDDELLSKISDQVDDYEKMRKSFGKQLAMKQQKTKNPLDWWDAFGGLNRELQNIARRILGLCCSASGCERNWSVFSFFHTERRNRLEHQRLSDLVYIQYNMKIMERFKKRREEGRGYNPLVLEEFQWDNEWVQVSTNEVHSGEDLLWSHVDEAIGASRSLQGRNLPRVTTTYQRRRLSSSSSRPTTSMLLDEEEEQSLRDETDEDNDIMLDDLDVEDDFGAPPPLPSIEGSQDEALESNPNNIELDID